MHFYFNFQFEKYDSNSIQFFLQTQITKFIKLNNQRNNFIPIFFLYNVIDFYLTI